MVDGRRWMRGVVWVVVGGSVVVGVGGGGALGQVRGGAAVSTGGAGGVEGEVRGGVVDEYLERATRYGFSGAALVDRGGTVMVARGYGLAERWEEAPNTAGTRFDIGALSMQFTAAAVLRLEMQGKLRTDDPATKFFDEGVGGVVSERARGITLHHLLTHTSGLHGGARLHEVDTEDRDAVVAAILSAESPFSPGAAFTYTTNNYVVLAAVVEQVTGKAFEDALRELVFVPAGMKETTFYGDDEAQDVAHGHEDVPPRGQEEAIGDVGPANFLPLTWAERGALGVLSTVRDLHRWHVALTGTGVLSEEAKKKLFTPVRQNYAYGWQVTKDEEGNTVIQHGGSTEGYEGGLVRWIGKDGRELGCVVLLINSKRGLGQRLQGGLSKFVLAASEAGFPEPPPKGVDVRASDLEVMAGRYRLPTGGAVEMVVWDGRLVAVPVGQDAAALLNLPTQHAAPVLSRASSRTAAVLKAWMTGEERDVRIFRNAAHQAVPAEKVDGWLETWGSGSVQENPLGAVEVMGSFVGAEGLQTVVRLRYKLAPETVRVLWRQDQIAEIEGYDVMEGMRVDGEEAMAAGGAGGRAGRPFGLAVGLVAEAGGSFAAMETGKWTVLRILPKGVVNGKVAGIEIRTGEQRVEGKREE